MGARRGGRRGATQTARELMLLLGALGEPGAALGASGIAARLNCSRQHALKLLFLLLQLRDAQGLPLPLASEGDALETLTLCRQERLGLKPLRLSGMETKAVLLALEAAGVGAQAGLAQRLLSSLGAGGGGALPAEAADDGLAPESVVKASVALRAKRSLRFSYPSGPDAHERRRAALPIRLRREEGHWYLDAFDLGRRGERTFRFDRMSQIELGEGAGTAGPLPATQEARKVRVTFDSPRWIEFFSWPGLVVEEERDGRVTCLLPYFGGMWLSRRLAACAGEAHTDDEELARKVCACARELLEGLRHLS